MTRRERHDFGYTTAMRRIEAHAQIAQLDDQRLERRPMRAPAAVARDQLEFAVAELSTHENQRVTKALNDGLQAALTGTKTPQKAMEDAQAEAERILKAYR